MGSKIAEFFGLGKLKGKDYSTLLDDTEKANAKVKADKATKVSTEKATKAKAAKDAKASKAKATKKAQEDALMAEVYANEAKRVKQNRLLQESNRSK